MHKPEADFYNVSGMDPNEGATIVFVWCPDDAGKYVLLGSGHVVGAAGGRPPGISVGQFSVTFPLRSGLSPDGIVVTSDRSGKTYLAGVTVTPCSTRAASQSGGIITSDDPVIHSGTTNGFPQSASQ